MYKNALIGLLAAAVMFGIGWLCAGWLYYSPRLETAATSLKSAQDNAALQKASAEACEASVGRQNMALLDLQAQLAASQGEAIAARKEAMDARAQHENNAQGILAEETPAGADVCQAASDAFDAELRRERGLK